MHRLQRNSYPLIFKHSTESWSFFFPILEASCERSINSVNMAPAKKRNVSSELNLKKAKLDLDGIVERILESRKHANDVFDILEFLQVREKYIFAKH